MKIFKNEKIRSAIVKYNVIPKLASLLIAIILAYIVADQKIDTISYVVPITPVNLPAEYIVSEMQKKMVKVFIEGNVEDLKNITRRSVSVEVDLRNPVVGKIARYELTVNSSEQGENIKYEISDKKIFIQVEKKLTKRIPVRVHTTGTLMPGWDIISTSIRPDFVTVTGPESRLSSIDFFDTENVVISGEKGAFRKNALISSKNRDYLIVVPEDVDINFNSVPDSEVEKFSLSIDKPVEIDGYEISLLVTNVNVFIKKNNDVKHESGDFSAVLDFAAYDPRNDQTLSSGSGAFVFKLLPVKIVPVKPTDYIMVATMPDLVPVKIRRK